MRQLLAKPRVPGQAAGVSSLSVATQFPMLPLGTPSRRATSAWLKQGECWSGRVTEKAIRRGSFTSVKDLTNKIDEFVQVDRRQFVARLGQGTLTRCNSWRDPNAPSSR
jgi:hypothetical protein